MKRIKSASLKLLFALASICVSFSAYAQEVVTGTVTDGTEPLIGATVTVKGTNTAVATDFDGNFALNVAQNKVTLQVSYIGYSFTVLKLGGES